MTFPGVNNGDMLYNVLSSGVLADNRTYEVRQQQGKVVLTIQSKDEYEINIHGKEKTWDFLEWCYNNLNYSLHDKLGNGKTSSAVVRFNGGEYEHNTDDNFIELFGTCAGNFTLKTGNVIGYVKNKDRALKISSRFGDDFLKYIIADADGFLELENSGGESHDTAGYEWLLAYLWNVKLKLAYRLGLPKVYVTKNERMSRARGQLDVVDYYQNKTSGKYLCSYREHSYDNPATALFIKAYELIKRSELIKHNSFCDSSRSIYQAMLTANQGTKYFLKELWNTPHFTNPFYSDYNVLIDLSKRILRHHGADFDSQHDSSAFLFDVSMLFEYFIRKLIKREVQGIQLREKSKRCWPIPTGIIGDKRDLEPDLVFEHGGGLYVFDVKYKRFKFGYGVGSDEHGVDRNDLFQLHTYIGQYGNEKPIRGCGFIYPVLESTLVTNQSKVTDYYKPGISSAEIRQQSAKIRQQGKKIPFYVLFLKIPDPGESSAGENQTSTDTKQKKADNWQNFCKQMTANCEAFTSLMQKIVEPSPSGSENEHPESTMLSQEVVA